MRITACFLGFGDRMQVASRIVKARRMGSLGFEDLKKMGVVLKRALYFITCGGQDDVPDKDGSGLYYKKSSEYKRAVAGRLCGMTINSFPFLMMTECRAQEEIWNETDLYMQ